jgi:hypothetical protein
MASSACHASTRLIATASTSSRIPSCSRKLSKVDPLWSACFRFFRGFIAVSVGFQALLLRRRLHKCYLADEILASFGMQLQRHAAGRSDALQHRERVASIFGILKAGNHGLPGANLLGKFGLSQTHILSHLADQESQINLMQGALKGLAVD